MLAQDVGYGRPQTVREGIVAQSTIRFAAGAGVVAASLLIVGPNPAQAVADKHGSGSHSRDDDRKSGSNGQGNRPKPSVPNLVDDVLEHRRRPGSTDLATPGDGPGGSARATTMDVAPDLDAPGDGAGGRPAATSKTLPVGESIAPGGPTIGRSPCGRRRSRRNPRASTHPAPCPGPGPTTSEPPAVSASDRPASWSETADRPDCRIADPEPVRENPVTPEVVPAVPAAIEVTIAPAAAATAAGRTHSAAPAGGGRDGHGEDRYDDRPAVRARRLDPDPRGRRRPRLPAGAGGSVGPGVSPSVGPCAGSFPTTTSGSRR